MVTTEHLAKRHRRKRVKYSDPVPAAGEKPCALRRAAVQGLQNQSAPTGPQPLARLVETRHRLTGPPRKSQQFTNPPGQRRLEYGREISRHNHRTACGPGEETPQTSPGARGF